MDVHQETIPIAVMNSAGKLLMTIALLNAKLDRVQAPFSRGDEEEARQVASRMRFWRTTAR
jgi:hypothetical protein